MPDLIPPHGGVAEPVNRTVANLETTALGRRDPGLRRRPLDPLPHRRRRPLAADRADGEGGVRPRSRRGSDRPQRQEVRLDDPARLPGRRAEKAKEPARPAHVYPLIDDNGRVVGVIEVQRRLSRGTRRSTTRAVYGTPREDHPGARIANSDPRTLPRRRRGAGASRSRRTRNTAISSCRRVKRAALFAKKGFQRVVAFQTRNALHRAHEYALVVGLERLTREGHFAGAVLNPLVGETKSDDVDAVTRMKTYRALIDNKALGQGDIDEELWKKVGRDLQRPRDAARPRHQDVLRRAEGSGDARASTGRTSASPTSSSAASTPTPRTTTARTSGTAWPRSGSSTN